MSTIKVSAGLVSPEASLPGGGQSVVFSLCPLVVSPLRLPFGLPCNLLKAEHAG